MKKKAELLQAALKIMKRQLKGGGVKFDESIGVMIEIDEARALVEALESLQWANIYEGEDRDEIGREFLDFETADYMGRLAEGFDYLETVGIIRLKDDEQ